MELIRIGAGGNRQFSNAIYGVLDYAAYPVGMLLVAPCILRNLGAAQYGVWAVACSVVSFASIIASGFGDANIQMVAKRRGARHSDSVLPVVRAAMGIHVVLGTALAVAVFAGAGILAERVCGDNPALRISCVICIRMAALLTAVRAVETVCISTHRAFERYGAAMAISVAGRVLTLAAAALVSSRGGDVAEIMVLSASIGFVAVLVQLIQLHCLLGTRDVALSFASESTRDLLRLGFLTWTLAVTGVLFSYADRLVGGATLGAVAVASYALCAQLSQPVYGLAAAGLHFLFPYLTRIQGAGSRSERNRALRRAFGANVVVVLAGTGFLFAFRGTILQLLSTAAIARACASLLPPVLAGSALLGLSVTGTYGMLALGRAQQAAMLNVIASIVAAVVVFSSLSNLGVLAIAAARIVFAAIALLVYVPLFREMRVSSAKAAHVAAAPAALEEA